MNLTNLIKQLLRDIVLFSQHASKLKLRSYQITPARAIVDSVIHKRGFSFVIVFPRQSGKNELQAQIETYLLTLYSTLDGEIVKVSPTWKPQSLNAMRRLERVLKRNLLTHDRWKRESGYIFKVGNARCTFLSGDPHANIVGATASVLLEVDEAQDVTATKYDKDVAPMGASTNVTRVFWGTSWTSKTLLARELRLAQAAQTADDAYPRTFVLTADDVAREVPAYGKYVAEQVTRFGRNHPLIRTQYFSEEIDAEGGLFTAARRALMHGNHPRTHSPAPGQTYAFLLDVGGEEEETPDLVGDEIGQQRKRDSSALTIISVDLNSLSTDRLPTYRVIDRKEWIGIKHSWIYSQLSALVDLWQPRYIIPDATGVGAGLCSFLDKAFPGRVLPFVFSGKSKSELGWKFVAIIETGRFKDYVDPDPERLTFELQLENVQYQAKENRALRWAVPNGSRNPITGELIYDDWVLSAALCAVLDDEEWTVGAPTAIIQRIDPLAEMDKEGW